MRLKAEQAAEDGNAPARPCNFTWVRLIKRVYAVDPLRGPKAGTTMKVVSFIESPQEEVIQKILSNNHGPQMFPQMFPTCAP